jgi:hypothetical protein
MKVHYTLPGYQPEIEPAEENAEFTGSFFGNHLPAFDDKHPVTWQEVLGLDRVPPDSSSLAPPPRPPSQIRDPSGERRLWRRMLDRVNDPATLAGFPQAVRQMLALLDEYQQREAALLAHGVSQESS